MNQTIITKVANELKIRESQVLQVLNLLEDGATVPFIARYRKEATGSLDEDIIRAIEKEYRQLQNIATRREDVMRLIEEKGMLTDELKADLQKATKLQQIEDIYLPFKEKRKTKATEAIKNGLEPLSEYLLTFPVDGNLEEEAAKYISEDVKTAKDAIAGAGHIVAEKISDTAKYREYIRNIAFKDAILETKLKKDGQEKDEKQKYEMYYEFSEGVKSLKSYRILAINRAEKEKVISVKINLADTAILEYLEEDFVQNKQTVLLDLFKEIIADSYKRLILGSIEREVRKELTTKAEAHAIGLFAQNLDVLIMQPPLKDKTILGVDPAFRTGCKLAVIDPQGTLLLKDVIYPTMPKNDIKGSSLRLDEILKEFAIDQIVVGNGTASRETEKFLIDYIATKDVKIPISIVSEAGASVYSASKIAIEEFPHLQVEERSAVSIARRILDPMAELVKIDPKSIGVGQYQHDVNQKELIENLDFVMIKNINRVGVNVNTASRELLKYVSGLDKTIAKNIVDFRNEFGKIENREQLKEVKRLGDKAFEQAAGFLKIVDGEEVLDQTFIHPESYETAINMMMLLEVADEEIGTEELKVKLENIDTKLLSEDLEVSEIVVKDILAALIAPNFDLRDSLKTATFDKTVTTIEELKPGMKLEGQVRNIVEFGAFVDIGLKNDALIHISQISKRFIKDVSQHLAIGDIKTFTIKEVDIAKNKIQLTLID